jgi:hypothetical protein
LAGWEAYIHAPVARFGHTVTSIADPLSAVDFVDARNMGGVQSASKMSVLVFGYFDFLFLFLQP